jgi:hypothetical protein
LSAAAMTIASRWPLSTACSLTAGVGHRSTLHHVRFTPKSGHESARP